MTTHAGADDRARTKRTLALLMAAVCLASCGGGGGGDVPAPGTPSPSPSPGPSPSPPPPGPPPPAADTQAPVVTLNAPVAFATNLTGTIAVTAAATDDVGVASVDVQVDGAAVGSALVNAPYTTSVDTTQYASGQHVVRAQARDAAGNVSDWVSATVKFGGSRAYPAGFTLNENWVGSLTNATSIAQASDGRFFVTQQGGQLRVVKNGNLLPTPALTLAVDSTSERGLLGVAVHPSFATNQFIYVYYTTAENGTHNRISRYTMNGDVVSVGSEVRIADLPTLVAGNHNGGAMHFGTDGTLYVGVGENAVGANASNTASPLGKLLRFNDDGTFPADNPFLSNTGVAKAVWAYGLRNPYTFAVKPTDGTIYINDVGEGTWEEINLGASGKNYGWPNSEGGDNVTSGVTGPIFTYKHSAANPAGSGPGGFFTGQAITGGAFYTGSVFPAAYRDSYYFADYLAKFVARYDAANNAAYQFGQLNGNPVDMIAGADGALYVLTRSSIARFTSP